MPEHGRSRSVAVQNMAYGIFMVVMGNLRHRIEKLGEELNDEQRTLRNIARLQEFDHVLLGQRLARPVWGEGAFFYCGKENAILFRHSLHCCHSRCSRSI